MGSIDSASASASASAQCGLETGCLSKKKPRVVFVLGGPGGGKTTQCRNVAKLIGYRHLSSGDLLREQAKLDTPHGRYIREGLKEAKIFDSCDMNKVILTAIEESGNDKFLLDGFPRSEENRRAFESETGIEPELVLYFDCPEEEREKRLLSRNQGREDDSIQSIEKRLKGFRETTIPVINYYESIGKVRRIEAGKSEEEVLNQMKGILASTIDSPNTNCLSDLLMYRPNCCAIL